MNVVGIKTENIQKLVAVEFSPGDDVIVVTGKNGSGKSSLLDSIFFAITGKKVDDPVRHGEDRAEVVVDLGEYIVKRVWTQGGKVNRVEVSNSEGAVFKSPQAMLDKMVGAISFDPQAFQDMKSDKQYRMLAELVGVDFSEMDTDRKKLYDERTLLNSDLKNKRALLETADVPPEGAPTERVSASKLLAEKATLDEKHEAHTTWQNNLDEAVEDETIIKGQLETALEEVEKLREQMNVVNADILRFQESPIELVPQSEFDSIDGAIADIDNQNALFTEAEIARENINNLSKAADEAAILSHNRTIAINQIDDTRIDMLESVEMPLDGLTMENEQVIYNGTLMSQLSDGEALEVSTAIAMAMNPKLKVILIRRGSLLDHDMIKIVTDMIRKKGYQLWIELVGDPTEVSLHIEDGGVTQYGAHIAPPDPEETEPVDEPAPVE